MKHNRSLSLLVIDDQQLVAERVIEKLEERNIVTQMAILDEKKELIKALRRTWDVVLFGRAYDLKYTDVLDQIRGLGLDMPVICMSDESSKPLDDNDHSDSVAVEMLTAGIARVLNRTHITRIALAIAAELNHLNRRRQSRETKNLLDDADMRTKMLLNNATDAVAHISEGVHVFANQSYLNLFGFQDSDELVGLPVIDLVASNYSADFKSLLKKAMKGHVSDEKFAFEGVRANDDKFSATLQLAPASYDGEPCIQMVVHSDHTTTNSDTHVSTVERIDNLTGLGNRLKFEEDLKKTRANAIKQHAQHGLMYISIDNIGQISSSMGIEGTDATIKHVADSLTQHFPDGVISRFSDSSFTVIIHQSNKDSLNQAAETLRADIEDDLINVGSRTVTTTISVGMVLINETSPETDELFSRAYDGIDRIRKHTQGLGNQTLLYDPYANATTSDSALFETVNNALDKNLFKLLYQPIYNVNTDAANFYEVYLRLPLPDGESLTPDQFLDIAEQCSMLERLDRWVLLNATKALRHQLRHDPQARIMVNLSKSAIQDNGLPEFTDKLNKAVGSNGGITLQFSEQDVTNYLGLAKKQFAAFTKAGCHISITNFGSSIKSIDLFTHLKPNFVKLDRSYAKNLQDNDNLSATQNFVHTVQQKGVDPMMAFIEDAASMSAAWSIGAPYLQGVYLQEPQPYLGNISEPAQA